MVLCWYMLHCSCNSC